MSIQINVNGEVSTQASISVLDHGFLFGDSVYEVVVTHKGVPCFLEPHLKRLRISASGLCLDIPWSNEFLIGEINKTLSHAGNDESYIRIVITRGEGDIDIDPTSCNSPSFIILVNDATVYPPIHYEKGINIALVSVVRNAKDAVNPGIKTGNYLNNVLAKLEANRKGALDALMLNNQGHLTECTTSNFFFVIQGRVLTPSLDCGILAGITRVRVLQLAEENGILVEEGEWPPESLEKAEEAFITGTVKKVMPVSQLDGHPIGNGIPGPVTRKLMRLYEEMLDQEILKATQALEN